ncbi:hypothetical protein BCR33DRAFT_720424 [Rhizoclosmatium globosum]|uniref:Uncharacterized protein n=1 Tax=Rhizoclosmatium globosum TaxID=329046 RepID=A0A1Y2BWQ1_9FUNG|nr:hypothetical protein HDU79_008087 [Rhizoclosmatium sp. JEL0117]ORY39192.1 hypothetical protein BCR33DRAFT_720424 [Rhizoclosmatium globosum]|eukprot:ORY39192.1 hypothetical protein BCR33DRAFT_720424 [Rhizoclosmatium globosum]
MSVSNTLPPVTQACQDSITSLQQFASACLTASQTTYNPLPVAQCVCTSKASEVYNTVLTSCNGNPLASWKDVYSTYTMGQVDACASLKIPVPPVPGSLYAATTVAAVAATTTTAAAYVPAASASAQGQATGGYQPQATGGYYAPTETPVNLYSSASKGSALTFLAGLLVAALF